MKIRLTTLSDNTVKMFPGLLAEWAWSILVETDEVKILFDTGGDIVVCHNANTLGIDLSKVDKIVLSHSHYDHTGGLREVLFKMKKEVEVIAHPAVWNETFHSHDHTGGLRDLEGRMNNEAEVAAYSDIAKKSIYQNKAGQDYGYAGIPFRRSEIENLGARFNLSAEPVKITENIMTTGEVPLVTDYEKVDEKLYIKEGDSWKPDTVPDDLSLVINTESGLVVVLGCCHRGVINTLYHAQKITGVKKINTVVGGSHLYAASDDQLWKTIAALKEMDIQKLGLCHCTGLPVLKLLSQEFGDRFFFNSAGVILDLP